MAVVDDHDVAQRLAKLADEVSASGDLRSPEWREAFLAVRRHVFVPRFWHDEQPGAFPAEWRMIDRATRDHAEWLDAVYSNRTLATDLTGDPTPDGGMHPQVTSSTTLPGLVLAMLEDLDVTDGMRVLEVGTGTGYNAALLCERLGDANVASIDVDPELVALATIRLADHNYRPTVVAGDGADGVPGSAPFDRIIATCGMDHIPQAWIDQCRDGAKIMANLRGPFTEWRLALLTVHTGSASGRFLRQSGSFMPRRTDPSLPFNYRRSIRFDATDMVPSRSPLDPRILYSDSTWGLLAQNHIRGMASFRVYVDGTENLATEIATADGSSWAVINHVPDDDGHLVRQAGPRRVWDELEHLHQQWVSLGEPSYDRIGLTVGRAGPPVLWLDDPDSGTVWTPPLSRVEP